MRDDNSVTVTGAPIKGVNVDMGAIQTWYLPCGVALFAAGKRLSPMLDI
jgi:hypothetical protein